MRTSSVYNYVCDKAGGVPEVSITIPLSAVDSVKLAPEIDALDPCEDEKTRILTL